MRVGNSVSRPLLSTALFGLIAPWIALAGSSDREIPDRTPLSGPVQHRPMVLRERRQTQVSSSNWSGYAVTGANGSVSDVQGSWIVPEIQGACPSSTQYASFWVGIDGYDTNTVEQIGTDSDCQGGLPVYYAWYEFYPKFAYIIPITINPGDVISAKVSYAGGKFTVSITDGKQSWSTSEKEPNAKRASAEWIIEASGGQPLADFDSVTFGSCEATVDGGSPAPIGSFATSPVASLFEITMVASGGANMSEPQPLTGGSTLSTSDSFLDIWLNAGP
jgi:hypothetical protein